MVVALLEEGVLTAVELLEEAADVAGSVFPEEGVGSFCPHEAKANKQAADKMNKLVLVILCTSFPCYEFSKSIFSPTRLIKVCA